MTLEVELLHRVENLQKQLDAHCLEHPLEHHDHLMDREEHSAHHAEIDKPKEKRAGERRGGSERRVGTDGPPAEGERRAG